MLYALCCSVNGSVCFMCCVFVNCLLYGIDHVWSSKECVCCACDPSECLDGGSQVFALIMLFLCVILHTMSSGKSLQLLCILPFCMLCLSAISMMFVKILLAVCMLVLSVLGVVFDQYLTFHDHISGICKSIHFHLHGIRRIILMYTWPL